jgi:hypothetical protein
MSEPWFGQVEADENDGNVFLLLSPRSDECRDEETGELSVKVESGEAHALLHSLAAHLQVELPPEGWRATTMRPNVLPDAQAGHRYDAGAWEHGHHDRRWWNSAEGAEKLYPTAAAAIAALGEGEPQP